MGFLLTITVYRMSFHRRGAQRDAGKMPPRRMAGAAQTPDTIPFDATAAR